MRRARPRKPLPRQRETAASRADRSHLCYPRHSLQGRSSHGQSALEPTRRLYHQEGIYWRLPRAAFRHPRPVWQFVRTADSAGGEAYTQSVARPDRLAFSEHGQWDCFQHQRLRHLRSTLTGRPIDRCELTLGEPRQFFRSMPRPSIAMRAPAAAELASSKPSLTTARARRGVHAARSDGTRCYRVAQCLRAHARPGQHRRSSTHRRSTPTRRFTIENPCLNANMDLGWVPPVRTAGSRAASSRFALRAPRGPKRRPPAAAGPQHLADAERRVTMRCVRDAEGCDVMRAPRDHQ